MMSDLLPPLPKLSGPGPRIMNPDPFSSDGGAEVTCKVNTDLSQTPSPTSSPLPCAFSTPTDNSLSESPSGPVPVLDVSQLDSTCSDISKTADVVIDVENNVGNVAEVVEVVTSKQKKGAKATKKQDRWTPRESESLISLVISEKYQNRFDGGKMSHKNIWTQLAAELHENFQKEGTSKNFNWQSCRDKFKNLRNKYKELKKSRRRQDQRPRNLLINFPVGTRWISSSVKTHL